jgi:hypothetical protein
MVVPSMTGRQNMIRKTSLTLIATGCLIAAALALAPGAPLKLAAVTGAETNHRHHYHMPRHVNRHALDGCLSEPVECGLVVW